MSRTADSALSRPVAVTRRTGRVRRGLTLIEMLIAVAGTVVVAAALATLVFAASTAVTQNREVRSLTARYPVIDARISAAIRRSELVLEQGTGYVVLWTGDRDGNDLPNLSEIELIELDSGTLCSFQAPATLDPTQDQTYKLSDDFGTITNALKGGALFVETPWATNVSDLQFVVNNVNVQLGTLVSYRVTLNDEGARIDVVGAGALRNF